MARVSVFGYRAGSSVLHSLDVRFKLGILLLLNLVVTRADIYGLLLINTMILLLVINLRISPGAVLTELRLFFLLLLFVFAARSFSEPGTPLISIWDTGASVEGVRTGGIVCWRLLQIVLIGMLFIRTSRPMEIKAAVYWCLAWIPGFPAHRVALMMSLMIRFIPLILELNGEITEAQQSRAVGLRKNPFYRLKVQVVPLLENAFKRADEMTLAMEARCYTDQRTDPDFSSGLRDWLILFVSILLGILALTI